MDEFQYRRKKQEVLEKFPPEFREMLQKSVLANHAYMLLVHARDVDPYAVLFEVIKHADRIHDQFKKYIEVGPPPQYIVGTQEMIDKLKKDRDGD
jgi:hypothetical protein